MELLFHKKGESFRFFSSRTQDAQRYIAEQNENYILNVNEEDFIQHVFDEFRLETPVLRKDDIHTVGATEVDIDVSNDFARAFFDGSRPFTAKDGPSQL